MRVSVYSSFRLALVLAVLPAAVLAQSGAPGDPLRQEQRRPADLHPPGATAPPLAANAGDVSQASREETEGNITALLPKVLELRNYSHHPFDAEISSKFLDRYLDTLDPLHLCFLESDLKQFEVYRPNLQNLSMRQRDFSPSAVIFSRFMERETERTAYVTNLLHAESFAFTNEERYTPNRHTLPHPANLDAAHALWREELRYEYLDQDLRGENMTVSGPAGFDAQSNVVILLPLEYTNASATSSTAAMANRTVQSLLPGELLDQEHHAIGSITPTPSNVMMRLQLSPKETLRKITNNFYAADGTRLGSIRFLHVPDTAPDTNGPAPVAVEPSADAKGAAVEPKQGLNLVLAGPPSKLKGVVELNQKDTAEIVKTLTKRYTGLLKNYNDLTNDDYVLESYLTSLAHVYDPHSDYMGHASMENFNIQMHLSLSGIGARLKSVDGDCKIDELVPEGPAAKSGQITNDDLILAVAQKDQEPVLVTGMPLLKVVEMIRGPKGTPVTLTVVKAHSTDASAHPKTTITLERDVIKLADQAAKAKFYETPSSSSTPPTRIGVIDLPSFYADTEPDPPGEPPHEHGTTSRDVAKLITRLKKENADGIILDLRHNPGGFLEEAIRLTGLFVNGRVPVVQVRQPDVSADRPGDVEVEDTPRAPVLYDGPLIVLTSRFSASASEIVAGALQDYGRAVIVGDKATWGKGTVQDVLPMSHFMAMAHLPYSYDPGSIKVTIKKFYRASGSSTQSNGVVSDIILPSYLNYAEIGESAESNPLPWDEITSADPPDLNRVQPYLPELLKRSLDRRARDKDFAYLQEDIDEYRKTLADKSVSLNEAERLTEQHATEARMEARKKERAARPKNGESVYEFTLKNVAQPGLHPPEVKPKPAASPDDDPDAEEAAAPDPSATDPALTEARRIMTDYIALLKKPLTAAANSAKEQ